MTQEQFDTVRFMALLEHFDNSNAGESGNAIRRALTQCSDADLSFVDALRLTFLADDDVRDEIRSELEQKYQNKMDAAAEAINTQEEMIRNHESENEQLREQLRQANKPAPRASIDWTPFRIPSIAWTWPTILTIALGLEIAWTWAFDASSFLMLVRYSLFIAWGVVCWRMEGVRVFIFKLAVWLAVWFIVLLSVNAVFHVGMYYHTADALLPWIFDSPFPGFLHGQILMPVFALLVLAGAVVLNVSPVAVWLTNEERRA